MKKLISLIAIIAALNTAIMAQTPESFGGLGISVYPGKKGASVASVLPNSPAAQAGLQAGDVIISVNGTLLSTVAPENQISMLRGNSGSSVTLQVSRAGENINILTKRAYFSVQDLKSQDVSVWFGKNKSVSVEELNYLASLKIDESYELLGVMQKGLLVNSDIENPNPQQMQHISMKKEAAKENIFVNANTPSIPKSTLNFVNRNAISFSLVKETDFARVTVLNVKGATVWQKNLGKLPTGSSDVTWDGANLPAGFYQARLEVGSTVLVQKFELR
ncbi:MAG: PDZ domain-containing protein [Fibromonadaceae bacterium]|jgi:membrane-associated protease RseP (regulator of RpoE activity)|nr:PDZ domain-containing protein [Fibromonadaceae bacterium]